MKMNENRKIHDRNDEFSDDDCRIEPVFRKSRDEQPRSLLRSIFVRACQVLITTCTSELTGLSSEYPFLQQHIHR